MSLEEICKIHGRATFFKITDEQLKSLVHLVRDENGRGYIFNPNNHDIFAGTFRNDKAAALIIQSIKKCVQENDFGDKFNELSQELSEKMPTIEGTRYALSFEQAFYVAKTHRPMDDIYVIHEQQTSDDHQTVLIKYISGEYA